MTLVFHYFGLAEFYTKMLQWAAERGIALLEVYARRDFFDAHERSVGDWAAYATTRLRG